MPIGVRGRTLSALHGSPRETPEPSQRTRGFVFLVLGAVTAAAAGARELRVYENGVGAMNLPLTEAQYGSHNTRAMRPETLVLAGTLFSLVTEQPFWVVNPSFALTKAQLCERAEPALRLAMTATVSCDTGLTHRASRAHLCGTCTSCLLRRQALRAGGLVERDDIEAARYRCDVRRISTTSDPQLQRLHYMLNQAAQLATGLRDAEPVSALVREFPDLLGIRSALHESGCKDPGRLTTRLLERYVTEWQQFAHPLVDRYLCGPGEVGRAA